MQANITIRKVENRYQPPKRFTLKVEELIKSKYSKDFNTLPRPTQFKIWSRCVTSCQSCPLFLETKGPLVPTYVEKPKALFIGRNPGKGDDTYSELFSTEASGGIIFRRYLRMLDLRRSECYLTNCCFCTTKYNRAPQPNQLAVCSEWKDLELKIIGIPRYIFAMGNDALRLFMGQSYPAVERVYGDLYLTRVLDTDTLIIPLQHPGFILRHPEEANNTNTLLETVSKIIKNPSHYNLPWGE